MCRCELEIILALADYQMQFTPGDKSLQSWLRVVLGVKTLYEVYNVIDFPE